MKEKFKLEEGYMVEIALLRSLEKERLISKKELNKDKNNSVYV